MTQADKQAKVLAFVQKLYDEAPVTAGIADVIVYPMGQDAWVVQIISDKGLDQYDVTCDILGEHWNFMRHYDGA